MGTTATANGAKKSPFSFTIYNGFLLSRPCNPVSMSVAERMVDIGLVGLLGRKDIVTWE